MDIRGLGNACVDERHTHRGVPTYRPLSLDLTRGALVEAKRQDLRSAAVGLGQIYRKLEEISRKLGTDILGEWALPTPSRLVSGERELNYLLSSATELVFGSDLNTHDRIRRYDRFYNSVIPDVASQALDWGRRTLEDQVVLFGRLWDEITKPEFGDWMHGVAQEISRRAGDCIASYEKKRTSPYLFSRSEVARSVDTQALGKQWLEVANNCIVAATRNFVQSGELDRPAKGYELLASQTPFKANLAYLELLQIFLVHPRFIEIVLAYSRSAAEGTRLAQRLIKEAAVATDDFAKTLTDHPQNVWRYPVLIIGSIEQLGINDVPGFQDFALGIGKILVRKTPEAPLNFLGWGLLVVGLVSTGLGAGVAVLDLALGGAAVYFTFVREHEQELAAKASLFLPDQRKFASEYGDGDSALAAAFMLIAAISLGRTLLKSWHVGSPVPPGGAARVRDRSNPTRPTFKRLEYPSDIGSRARFRERQSGAFAGPKRSTPGRTDAEQVRVASSDVPGAPAPTSPKQNVKAVGAKATSSTEETIGSKATANNKTTNKAINNSATSPSPVPPARVPGTLGKAPNVTPGTDPRTASGGIEFISAKETPLGERHVTIAGEVRPQVVTTSESLFRKVWPEGEYKPAGLSQYDKAHLFPTQWGDEAYEGFMWARYDFNRSLQKRLENELAYLRKVSPATPIKVRVTAISYPKGTSGINSRHVLKELRYEFQTSEGLFIVECNIATPPSGTFEISNIRQIR